MTDSMNMHDVRTVDIGKWSNDSLSDGRTYRVRKITITKEDNTELEITLFSEI